MEKEPRSVCKTGGRGRAEESRKETAERSCDSEGGEKKGRRGGRSHASERGGGAVTWAVRSRGRCGLGPARGVNKLAGLGVVGASCLPRTAYTGADAVAAPGVPLCPATEPRSRFPERRWDPRRLCFRAFEEGSSPREGRRSCSRATVFPLQSICKSAPLELRRTTQASARWLLTLGTWSRRLWKATLIRAGSFKIRPLIQFLLGRSLAVYTREVFECSEPQFFSLKWA